MKMEIFMIDFSLEVAELGELGELGGVRNCVAFHTQHAQHANQASQNISAPTNHNYEALFLINSLLNNKPIL